MAAEPDSDNVVPHVLALEREILRSLCISPDPALPRQAILRALSSHTWHDPDHRVVYEALRRAPPSPPSAIRSHLPAAATRMGFPDVDWQPYLKPGETLNPAEIEALMRALLPPSASGSQ